MDEKVGVRTGAWIALVGVLGLVGLAERQANAQGAAPPPPLPPAPAAAPPAPTMAAPPAPPPVVVTTAAPEPVATHAGPEEPREEPPDHERFIHHFGVGYFGIAALPIANPILVAGATPPAPMPGGITSSTVSAPVLGVRYWVQDNIGVDVGIGLGFRGGSNQAVSGGTSMSVDLAATNGFAFHGGVPIALYHGRHYTFLVVPQFTVGVTSATQKFTAPAGAPPGTAAAPDQDLSGFLFDGGGVIGAEIYFGFIGIPELALQATVGLSFRRSVFKWKSGDNSASNGSNTFGTNVQSDPWAIFANNISAMYYF